MMIKILTSFSITWLSIVYASGAIPQGILCSDAQVKITSQEGKQVGSIRLSAGREVQIIKEANGESFIKSESITGWVATASIEKKAAAQPALPATGTDTPASPTPTQATTASNVVGTPTPQSEGNIPSPSSPTPQICNEVLNDTLTTVCTNNADSFGIHMYESGKYYSYYQTTYQYRNLNPSAIYQIKLQAPPGCEPNIRAWVGYQKLTPSRIDSNGTIFDIPKSSYTSCTLRVTALISHITELNSNGNVLTPINFRAIPTSTLLSSDTSKKIIAGYNTSTDNITTTNAVPSGFERTFKWDTTVVAPNNFVYLKIPLIPQIEGGMCTAAASLNALKFIDNSFNLSVPELFDIILFKPGHTSLSTAKALEMLGFHCNFFTPRYDTANRIKDALNHGHPVMAATKEHMVVIVGYNQADKKFYLWDQHHEISSPSATMGPKGQFEVGMKELTDKFIAFIEPFPFTKEEILADSKTEDKIKSLTGSTTIEQYSVPALISECPTRDKGQPLNDLEVESYKTRIIAGIQKTSNINRLKALLRKGGAIAIPTESGYRIPADGGGIDIKSSSIVKVMPNEVSDERALLEGVILPSKTPFKITISDLTQLVALNKGTIYFCN